VSWSPAYSEHAIKNIKIFAVDLKFKAQVASAFKLLL